MIGPRATVGLLVLCCALVLSAFGAAGASASGTTAFTCDPSAAEGKFSDAHCENSSGSSFGHTRITGATKIIATNNTTGSESPSWTLKGVIGGTAIQIECPVVSAEGELANSGGAGTMKVTGSGTFSLSGCLLKKPEAEEKRCTVAVENLTATFETSAMNVKFVPKTGTAFTKVTIGGVECAAGLKGTFPLEGSALATDNGGTANFSGAATKETLTLAGSAAELEGGLTFKMAAEGAKPQNAIVLVTEIGATAFTCSAAASVKDFADAHCDTAAAEGAYGHTAITTPNTEVVASNNTTGTETTEWRLGYVLAATSIEIKCGTASASGKLTNNAGPPMTVTGSGSLSLSGCSIAKPATQSANCVVTFAPASYQLSTNEMEVVIGPSSGTTLTEFTISNAPGKTCKSLTGTFPLVGSFAATGVGGEAESPKWSGATLRVTPAMSRGTLSFAGNPAEFTGGLTFRTSAGNDPVTLTTE